MQLNDVAPAPVVTVDLGPGVRAGFTSRSGGSSRGPWGGFDLALHVGDDPAAVRRNRRVLAGWAGAPVRFARQVHGTTVLDPANDSAGWPAAGHDLLGPGDDDGPEADGLVTARPALPLGVLVADCVPVLLADAAAGVVAAAHAGRRGLLAGVLTEVVAAMAARGADPGATRAAVGPAAGGCCYEVPAQLQAQAVAARPELLSTTRWGTPALDLRAGAVAELAALGLAHVELVGGCTIEDGSLYSYRRAAVTGRFAGVVTLLP